MEWGGSKMASVLIAAQIQGGAASPKSRDLRKYEPHPVGFFLACLDLAERFGINGLLRGYEAVELEGVRVVFGVSRHVRLTIGRGRRGTVRQQGAGSAR